MAESIYTEEIAAETAKMILQDEFIGGSDMKYYMISEYYHTVIVQKNMQTGKETEITLEDNMQNVEEPVPHIESYKHEYKNTINKGVLVQILVIVAVAAIMLGCWILIR